VDSLVDRFRNQQIKCAERDTIQQKIAQIICWKLLKINISQPNTPTREKVRYKHVKLYFCKCLEADCAKETSTKIGVAVIPAYKQKARRREEKRENSEVYNC
jgi:hypothetical protein